MILGSISEFGADANACRIFGGSSGEKSKRSSFRTEITPSNHLARRNFYANPTLIDFYKPIRCQAARDQKGSNP